MRRFALSLTVAMNTAAREQRLAARSVIVRSATLQTTTPNNSENNTLAIFIQSVSTQMAACTWRINKTVTTTMLGQGKEGIGQVATTLLVVAILVVIAQAAGATGG
jgi:hypothetical protein